MQFVVFKHAFDYCDYLCADLKEKSNVILIEPYSFGWGISGKKRVIYIGN